MVLRGLETLNNTIEWDGKKLCRIETAREILAELGNPQDQVRSVHVAGTNGKGSVCSTVSACLLANGFSVGQFCSPHLSSIVERCVVNGLPISPESFDRQVLRAFAACERLGVRGSYFVIGMAASFLEFAERKLDRIVIEVGVGGLWDATNAISSPEASVITHIGYDHTHILGETLVEIAANKAGIIKPGRPVFAGANEDSVREVFRAAAAQNGSVLECYGEDFWFDAETKSVCWGKECVSIPPELELLKIPARIENACVAVRTAAHCGCDSQAIATGLRAMRWPGRMEQFQVPLAGGAAVQVATDGMHNIDGAPVALKFLETVLEANPNINNLVILFAMRSGKDWREVLDLLQSRVAVHPQLSGSVDWIFTGADLSNMASPSELCECVLRGEAVEQSEEAFARALSKIESAGNREQTLLFITGSLYLLGKLRPKLSNAPFSTIAFEVLDQSPRRLRANAP